MQVRVPSSEFIAQWWVTVTNECLRGVAKAELESLSTSIDEVSWRTASVYSYTENVSGRETA
jgi:hypothetical protein